MEHVSPDFGTSPVARLEQLRKRLKEVIYGQDGAVDEMVNAFIHLAYKPLELPPLAIFTFVGPAGSGRSYLAETLVELVDDFEAFKKFDMEQYATPEEGGRLLGTGTEPGGELISFISAHPRSVILFDGIEQANSKLQLALLELFSRRPEEGGIDCRGVVVIYTTSLGSGIVVKKDFQELLEADRQRALERLMAAIGREKKIVYEMVENAIAPKLLSHLARRYIVLFRPLGLADLVRVGSEALQRVTDHFAATSGIEVRCPRLETLVTLLILSFAPNVTVGRIRQSLPDAVLFRLTSCLEQVTAPPKRITLTVSRAAARLVKELARKTDAPLQRLFKRNETAELLWRRRRRGDTLIFTIAAATLARLTPAVDTAGEEWPRIEFSPVGFDDIAGNRSVKESLRQVVTILRQPAKVRHFGIDMPKGMLLYGPPGVGKTMLSRAFAREAELPYVYAARSDLFDPNYLQLVYQKARQYAPSIVFLDGIDVKGLVEGVMAPIPVDRLVLELDSVSAEPDEFVFTVATAANRDEVSASLLEPGRIDIFVEVPELDREARRFFIEKILEKPNDGRIDVDKVVRYLSGMSCHDLERIGKEAALSAIRGGGDMITEELLIEQINIIKYGTKLEKKHIRNLEEDLKITAYHEAAHAVLSSLLLPEIKIEQVTIAPRLRTLGFISYTAEDFAGNVSKEEIFSSICVLLGGRAAEVKKFGARGIDSGAATDLEQATHQAYVAIANLGMDEELGLIHADTLAENVNRELFRQQIEERVAHWISTAATAAEKLVEEHWGKIERLAEILVRQEIVDGAELDRIMAEG